MLVFVGCGITLHSQQPIRISGEFSQQELKNIFIQLEQAYPIRFFFRDSDLPVLPVSITFEDELLLEASRRLLEGSGLQSFLFQGYAVVVFRDKAFSEQDSIPEEPIFSARKDSLLNQEEMGEIYQLDAVTISSREEKSLYTLSGLAILDRTQIEALPAFMGESDLIQGLLYIPGVSKIGEGATGINVRGGNTDENLILLGENMLFNMNHAFGFFSSIHPGLIREVNLYKGAIPAYYGGRLSSVMDIQMKQASTEKFKLEGGIGPLSGKVIAELPLKKGINSLLIGGRSLYSDWLLSRVNIPEIKNSDLFFYDLNLNYLHHLNDRSILSAELYSSADDFQFSDEFGFSYQSKAASLMLRSLFQKKLSSTLSLAYNSYQSTRQDLQTNRSSGFDTGIRYYKLKEKLSYTRFDKVKVDMGASMIYYTSQPGNLYRLDPSSSAATFSREDQQAIESAAFVSLDAKPSEKWNLVAGLRVSHYRFLGPGQRLVYLDDANPATEEILDAIVYPKHANIASYSSPEPRLSVNYLLSPRQSLKLGYGRNAQYLFQMSSFDSAIPTDAWTLSNYFLKPQRAHNLSLEFAQHTRNSSWTHSLGIYYRQITDLKDYVDFADLLSETPVETEIVHARGRAYGLEINIQKTKGNLRANLSYTLSRSEKKTSGSQEERSINSNDWYLSNFDKPHELSVFLDYRFNRRNSLALSFNYSSGRPITAPIGYFDIDGQSRTPIYAGRNLLRIPAYHRLDLAYKLDKSLKRRKKWKGSWTFGIYNVYGRKNAYSVFFSQARFAKSKANRLSILGSAFPAISYNFIWTSL